MGIRKDFSGELERRIGETVQRLNIPSEYQNVFHTLFSTFMTLFHLSVLMKFQRESYGLEARKIMASLEVIFDGMLGKQIMAMKELGSQFIDIDQFLREIDSLKAFCDEFRQDWK